MSSDHRAIALHSSIVASKWSKTKQLNKSGQMRKWVPSTAPFNRSRLKRMLDRHRSVYLKPDIGSLGYGIMRAQRMSGRGHTSWYQLQWEGQIESFGSFDALYKGALARMKKKRYLIQNTVHAIRYRNRHADIRVMVTRGAHGWRTSGMLARVAHPSRVVTNGHHGGMLLRIDDYLSPVCSRMQIMQIKRRLEEVGRKTGRQLQQRYPKLKTIGLDVALDSSFRPWILEVNTRPDTRPFQQ